MKTQPISLLELAKHSARTKMSPAWRKAWNQSIVGMLAQLEWSVGFPGLNCPMCGSARSTKRHRTCSGGRCDLDVALTVSGLNTQKKREAARRAFSEVST